MGNRDGENVGMVGFLFDGSIHNTSDKAQLLNLLENAKTLLSNLGHELTVEQLNEFEQRKSDPYFMRTWDMPIKTESLKSTLTFIQQVLKEEWTQDNGDINYVGFPAPNGSITV